MPTGNGSSNNARSNSNGNGRRGEIRATGLRFASDRLIVALIDQREVSVPIECIRRCKTRRRSSPIAG